MWTPDKNALSLKETIGRRVFEESPYTNKGGRKFVKIDCFLDSRESEDGLSFDRLGVRQNHYDYSIGVLSPIALSEANRRKPPRPFGGWLGIKVNAIKTLGIRPDPITDEPKNIFHALLPINNFRDPIHAETLAYTLARAADECGLFLTPKAAGGSVAAVQRCSDILFKMLQNIIDWLRQ